MFYDISPRLTQTSIQEQKLTSMISGLSSKLDSLMAEFDDVIAQIQTVFKQYQLIGNVYGLSYKEDLTCSYKNLEHSFKIMKETLKDSIVFMKQPVFEFIGFHNEQTACLQKYISKNQDIKNNASKIEKICLGSSFEKKDVILSDIEKFYGYINHVTHNQFKSFYLLKNRDIMMMLSKDILKYIDQTQFVRLLADSKISYFE